MYLAAGIRGKHTRRARRHDSRIQMSRAHTTLKQWKYIIIYNTRVILGATYSFVGSEMAAWKIEKKKRIEIVRAGKRIYRF